MSNKKNLLREDVFSKILQGQIQCEKVYENKYCLAFKDIKPQAKIHFLLIPKTFYMNLYDFNSNATSQEKTEYWNALNKILQDYKITENAQIVSNIGAEQEVKYFHIHILSK